MTKKLQFDGNEIRLPDDENIPALLERIGKGAYRDSSGWIAVRDYLGATYHLRISSSIGLLISDDSTKDQVQRDVVG